MENKLTILLKEFYELNQEINDTLLSQHLLLEATGKLSLTNLKEFEDLNKRSFLTTSKLIQELKNRAV